MTKTSSRILGLVLAICLGSCSDDTSEKNGEPPTEEATSRASSQPATTQIGWIGSRCDILADVGVATSRASADAQAIMPGIFCFSNNIPLDDVGVHSVTLHVFGNEQTTQKLQLILTSPGIDERYFGRFLYYTKLMSERLGFSNPEDLLSKVRLKQSREETYALSSNNQLGISIKLELVENLQAKPFRYIVELAIISL